MFVFVLFIDICSKYAMLFLNPENISIGEASNHTAGGHELNALTSPLSLCFM